MKLLFILIISYLIGSVPFALVIGKVFYNTDVREHGSKNLGGSNTGRTLGKKTGLSVMALDLLKVSFVVFLAYPFIIAKRIRNEEEVLERELKGYKEYKKKVKYKLTFYNL